MHRLVHGIVVGLLILTVLPLLSLRASAQVQTDSYCVRRVNPGSSHLVTTIIHGVVVTSDHDYLCGQNMGVVNTILQREANNLEAPAIDEFTTVELWNTAHNGQVLQLMKPGDWCIGTVIVKNTGVGSIGYERKIPGQGPLVNIRVFDLFAMVLPLEGSTCYTNQYDGWVNLQLDAVQKVQPLDWIQYTFPNHKAVG